MQTLQQSHVFNRPSDRVCVQYWLPGISYPEHDHDYHEILFLLSGTMTHIVNGSPWFMRAGSFMALRAEDRHAFTDMHESSAINLLHVPLGQLNWFDSRIASLFEESEPQLWHMATPGWMKVVRELNAFACAEMSDGGESGPLRSALQETFLLRLLAQLPRYCQTAYGDLSVDERVCLAMSWVDSHWQLKVEWSTLADRFSLTLRTFQRRFKQRTGMTPQQYLIALRLRHARFLMQQGVHSLRDIAEYCHFYDASHLGACLRQQALTSTSRVYRDSSPPTSPSRRKSPPE
ncbi:TPA: helix-turn-helix domain-containing protein [Kluyvera georgiana]